MKKPVRRVLIAECINEVRLSRKGAARHFFEALARCIQVLQSGEDFYSLPNRVGCWRRGRRARKFQREVNPRSVPCMKLPSSARRPGPAWRPP